MTTLKHMVLAALLAGALTAGACGGGDSEKPAPAGTGGMTSGVGGGAGGTQGTGGAGGAAIPLVDWVTDLATHYNNDTSPPDTVADKNIADTDDPKAFDPLLQR